MSTLTGKTALVTGGSRGIGRAVALRLAADGARVAVHYGGNKVAADETVGLIEDAGGRAFAVRADFAAADAADRMFEQLVPALDGAGLDILVNNAGIGSTNPVAGVTAAEFDELFTVNVRTPFLVVQRALPLLNDGGRVVQIGSVASTRIAVSTQIAYTMTKAALDAMTPSLANELGRRGITVNTVAPGVIRTDLTAGHTASPEAVAGLSAITALGRLGEPEDVAGAVGFLAGPDAAFVTGQTLDVCGGNWLGPIIPA
ncbi:SDR family NAD(P)-dependent oxidoreductase [Actinomadura macrotermitis]|uniref:3-oxoacyl-[acyl-carrier-protein] reductase FabG n=1 Tax=Actinomadura macrotermitis TaxID=2585200 RepID=A0A7K0C182_9ACTN|nr:SDR family oxidoreductase [Actinomadura macrotermitis]MQY07221.1 3-oxoacyl-[acyl-carrier-protein] reductase FabG [Actinomadura macrotermitis]